jgi:putative endopeptidase
MPVGKKGRSTRRKQNPILHSLKKNHKQQNYRKTKRRRATSLCNIPTQAPALNYSSSLRNSDFYTWVNEDWLQKAKIKPHESLTDAGEDTEVCLYEKTMNILEKIQKEKQSGKVEILLRDLAASALHSRAQQNSVLYVKQYLNTLHCIRSTEDVFRTAVQLNYDGFRSLFELQITVDSKGTCQLMIENNPAGLYLKHYRSREIMKKYKTLLKQLGDEFDIADLEQSIHVEKYLVEKSEEYYTDTQFHIKGSALLHKFPGIPWEILFTTYGITDWKQRTIYYSSPRYIRFLGCILRETSVDMWKLFFARCFIISSLHLLPPPFDEYDHNFFGRVLYGEKVKTPQHQLLFQIISTYVSNEFSELFWKEEGNDKLQEDVEHMAQTIINAAKSRIHDAEWLEYKTRQKAIEKLDRMKQSVARPTKWLPFLDVVLDPKNLLKNCVLLAQRNSKQYIDRLDKQFTFWEHSILRVNASYYQQMNQMIIPYGQMQPPFYSKDASLAWNYGALGSIIGHEICHGFDEDGKDYNAYGQKKPWWTKKNNRAYKKKTRALIDLFSAVTMQGHHVKGEQMLSENLADLAGVALSLHAMKKELKDESSEKLLDAYRTFFISYATSWRTKYREERLTRLLEKDVHAPAELRVNLIVSQFQEWIDAFTISKDSPLYKDTEERIVIF